MNSTRNKLVVRLMAMLAGAFVLAGAITALQATPIVQAPSASATVPQATGKYDCLPDGTRQITWTVASDPGYPNETATVKEQSRPTSPTLVGQSVKGSSVITATEVVNGTGTYTFYVKVQWTNHANGDWVKSNTASVKVTGSCVGNPTQDVTCDAITGDYHRPLGNGDHINVTIDPGGQINMYVDQNVPGGADYGGQNDLGLRWKIFGVEQTPIPLTVAQIESGIISFPYGASLTGLGMTGWTVTFVQTNGTDTWPDFKCGRDKYPPSGNVTFDDTVCQAAVASVNLVHLTLEDNSIAEAFLWDGAAWVSIGNLPAGNYGDDLFDSYGFPAQIRIVITGEDSSQLPPFEHTFTAASKDAAACEIISLKVDASYTGVCTYDTTLDESFKEGEIKLDNTGSNIPVSFVVSAPYSALSQIVPAGDVVTLSLGDIPKDGVAFQISAGGQIFDVTLDAFDGCKPITPYIGVTDGDCQYIGKPVYDPNDPTFAVTAWTPSLDVAGPHTATVVARPDYVLPGGVPSIDLIVDIPDKKPSSSLECTLAMTGVPPEVAQRYQLLVNIGWGTLVAGMLLVGGIAVVRYRRPIWRKLTGRTAHHVA